MRRFKHLPEGTIIIAEELTPADTALLDPRRVAGFATVLGGAESHTAIMARSLELPAVLGVAGLLTRSRAAITVVDRRRCRHASSSTRRPRRLARIRAPQRERSGARAAALRACAAAAVTRDGAEIGARRPISNCRASSKRRSHAGAGGVGLLRTEFLYMNRDDLPDEDEQYEAYARSCAAWRAGRSPSAPSISAATSWRAALSRHGAVRAAQSGAGPARDPPIAAGPPAARHPARGDAARRGARAGAHPAADDLHGRAR